MNKLIAFFLLAACMGSCTNPETKKETLAAEQKDSVLQFEQKSYDLTEGNCDEHSEGCLIISIDYFQFIAEENKTADSLNKIILGYFVRSLSFFESENENPTLEECAGELAKEYRREMSENPDQPSGWTVEGLAELKFNTPELVSFEISIGSYLGGAHPNSDVNYITWNLSENRKVEITDIVTDTTAFTKLVEIAFRKARELKPDEDLFEAGFEFESGAFELNNNFLVDGEGITFYYNAYEIAAYVYGPTSVTIRHEDCKHYLQPWFKNVIEIEPEN